MKQVILVIMDLKIPLGKLCVQCSHASVASVLKTNKKKLEKWIDEGMMKAILKVKDLDELLKYKEEAEKNKLVCALITDSGKTVFKEPTVTCLAIGPDDDEKIDNVTGKLKLL